MADVAECVTDGLARLGPLGTADLQWLHPHTGRYARWPRNSFHSLCVRSRCATRQARASHATGSTFQTTPVGPKLARTCVPSGKNSALPPPSDTGIGAPISFWVATSQSRRLPS